MAGHEKSPRRTGAARLTVRATATTGAPYARIRQRHLGAGVIADPEASNTASRRVLGENGFRLLDQRPLASQPTAAPIAIHRLSPDVAAR
jgi:hypothetical protein